MKRTSSALCLALGWIQVVLGVQSSGEIVLFASRRNNGPEIEWVVDRTGFCGNSKWRPETDTPPLSTTRAVQTALSDTKPSGRWIVTEVSIRAVSCGEYFGWYYFVEMYDEGAAFADVPPNMSGRLVLMDGSLVLPRQRAR
jgi:hypothetical protein